MGSQLKQLKASLTSAGLARHSEQSSSKKRKRGGTVEQDREKKAARLEEIKQQFNPFDVKVTKLKHDVGGRKLKGVVGKPSVSKQAGLELRKKTLLVELARRNHAGGIVDRRFGEDDPTIPVEDRMLERFTRERQRTSKGSLFNLEDEANLTHLGQSLSTLDDFVGAGLTLEDEEDEDSGQIDHNTVRRTHFGGFGDEDADDARPRKKTKAEVMAEVMAKSKEHKHLRQIEREKSDNARHELDQEFDAIHSLLVFGPSQKAHNLTTTGDQDYDQLVHELAFDRRSKPTDRTKTEEELALEQKEELEQAEKARLRRMRGEDEGSEDDRRVRKKRRRGGDELDDEFSQDDFEGFGTGLTEDKRLDDDDDKEDDDVDDDDSVSGASTQANALEESERSVSDEDDYTQSRDSEDVALVSTPGERIADAKRELPFTFPCPSTHSDLLAILNGLPSENVDTVIRRIRTLHHPSLGNDNKFKLQALIGVLVEHVLYASAPPQPNLAVVSALVPHLFALSQSYPLAAAEVFVSKLKLMHKNLTRGLGRGPLSLTSKTWPGPAELVFLRTLGSIWSTSDKHHTVVGPARLLMSAYLGLGRVRSAADIASGLFLCSLFLQYEEASQRFVPEVVNFLFNAILHLAPLGDTTILEIPGSFPTPDFKSELCAPLRLSRKASRLNLQKPDIIVILCQCFEPDDQTRVNLLGCVLELCGRISELYKGVDGYIELFEPLPEILNRADLHPSSDLQSRLATLQDRLARLSKFSLQARRPLRLQAHKPIPIATYIPKFTSSGGSSYLRVQDPDRDRAEAAKLRRQYKQEKKGAIKELRRDARFMAEVAQKKQEDADKSYSDRMRRVIGSLEDERAQEKAAERDKLKAKKRTGRK